MPGTLVKAKNMFGNIPYQERARRALPILIRQAQAKKPIVYANLAHELEMSNPRNLNYVLGSVGTTLNELSSDIPHPESLVINDGSRIPGGGFEDFLKEKYPNYVASKLEDKKQFLEEYWSEVFGYPDWDKVLHNLNIKPILPIIDVDHENSSRTHSFGGGESFEHKQLKEFIYQNPKIIGLKNKPLKAEMEYGLLSGDKVDVGFQYKNEIIAVEVKSKKSDITDIQRGLFQCVKYDAVIRAQEVTKQSFKTVKAYLVLEGEFPKVLIALKNCLGIEVYDQIIPTKCN